MSAKVLSTRDRIVAATIGVIGQEGLQALTTRRIAQEAGVNIAAINYYFGSKDKLVEIALEKTLDEMAGLPGDFLELEKLDARARLRAFLAGLMGGAVKYPGLVKAHLYPTLINNDYDTPFVRRFNSFLTDIYDKASDLKTAGSEQEMKTTLIQIMSAILMPAVFPKIFQEFSQIDFANLEARKNYIDSLLRNYLD
jgi:AcrR family transcriptional regulator